MSTSLPIVMPAQATAGGESASLPVNTDVGDSSQAFANVLGSHIRPDAGLSPLSSLEGLIPPELLATTTLDGQNLPLDLSLSAVTDGNALPLSPELMWSGMLITNNSTANSPQLYQLSEDGQTLSPQIDPNMRAQILQAMNRYAPVSNMDMPEMLAISDSVTSNQTPGLSNQSYFFAATATPVLNAMAAQKAAELLPNALLNSRSLSTSPDSLLALSGDGTTTSGIHHLGLGATSETGTSRFPELMQMHMAGSPKNPAWAQGLGERVQWLIQQNIQGAEIRLNPPELGALEIKLQLSGDQGTQIHFTSPNGSVREALEAAIPRLREMFAENGLMLGDVNVSHQSLAEQQRDDNGGETSGNGNSSGIASSEQGDADDNLNQNRLVSDGLVDMYV